MTADKYHRAYRCSIQANRAWRAGNPVAFEFFYNLYQKYLRA